MFKKLEAPRNLFDKLIVLLLIAIFVLVAIPNFVEYFRSPGKGPTHARVGMRSLSTAIESYFSDFGEYPPSSSLLDQAPYPEELIEAGGSEIQSIARTLSTEKHFGRFFSADQASIDPFTRFYPWNAKPGHRKPQLPFAYYALSDEGWILFSPGPDGDYDIVPSLDYVSTATLSYRLLNKTYDPTNGLRSNGDIFRVKQPEIDR